MSDAVRRNNDVASLVVIMVDTPDANTDPITISVNNSDEKGLLILIFVAAAAASETAIAVSAFISTDDASSLLLLPFLRISGKSKKARKFAVTKNIISPKDTRVKRNAEKAKCKSEALLVESKKGRHINPRFERIHCG